MGNKSNLDTWAAMERMRFIERSAYWRGVVNRQDLTRVFGLSMAQASSDLQEYQRANPGALAYNLNRKRYEGTEGLTPRFTTPQIEEAMSLFLEGGADALPLAAMTSMQRPVPVGSPDSASAPARLPQVRVVRMPLRSAPAHVERRVFLAVLHGQRVHVRYYSMNSGTEGWRWLRPSGFAHDGNRWHVRAWCEQRQEWSDFTLSRIADAEWPVPSDGPIKPDAEAATSVTLELRPHPSLSPEQRSGVGLDFGMTEGSVRIEVASDLGDYLRARLGAHLADGTLPGPLVEVTQVKPANGAAKDGVPGGDD